MSRVLDLVDRLTKAKSNKLSDKDRVLSTSATDIDGTEVANVNIGSGFHVSAIKKIRYIPESRCYIKFIP